MNKTILVLNALILVVNSVVSLSSSDVHGQLLDSASRNSAVGDGRQVEPTGRALSQVLTALQSLVPATQIDAMDREQLSEIETAIRHYRWMAESRSSEAIHAKDERPVRVRLEESNKQAREELERMLGPSLKDDNLVRQVTTAIIRVA